MAERAPLSPTPLRSRPPGADGSSEREAGRARRSRLAGPSSRQRGSPRRRAREPSPARGSRADERAEDAKRARLAAAPVAAGTRSRRPPAPPEAACRYPLRNRADPPRDLSADSSASSTDSDSSQPQLPRLRKSSSVEISEGIPKPDRDIANNTVIESKTRSGAKNRSLQTVSSPRPSTSKRSSLGSNLGGWQSATTSTRNKPSKRKSLVLGRNRSGPWGSLSPRSARSHDMPQNTTPTSANTSTPNKREKKGKGALGSCASSGAGRGSGSAEASALRATRSSLPDRPGSPIFTVASTSSTAQVTAVNMTGGQSIDSKAKGKGAAGAVAAPAGGSSSSDEGAGAGEVGRLQALLEARGLPPHLLGALGPRMQHLLHRTMGASSAASKAAQLLSGLQATGDEGQQLQAVIEMCQLLVMGNEDTLAGFPVRQVVPALINLLSMDHNFDMMNHACRALTYMMEALPRASGAVALAVPAFLGHLQAITCMDVAEQSLTALDMLSRRHSKAILHARGVAACLMYLDFFSINAQRAALSITSNCCQNLTPEEFNFVRDSLPLLANRLTQHDKKSVESVCLAFSRLVDSYQHDSTKLQEIASPELLTSLQQLLVVSPPLISTGTFITVLRMLGVMCSACPSLAVALHSRNIGDTLLYLLTGSTTPATTVNLNSSLQEEIELIPRSPQEIYEITSLIAELMPRLPTDGIFAVDAYLDRPWGSGAQPEPPVQWQWRDDRGVWRAYAAAECRLLEAALAGAEDEAALALRGRSYTVDLHSMQQLNDDSGTARPVQRRLQPPHPPKGPAPGSSTSTGSEGAPAAFVRQLLGVLSEVYAGSAGPAVRCQCLKAMLRIVYHSDADLLRSVLKNQVMSSLLAGMLASADLRVCCGALQLADILLRKLPLECGQHFRREGVLHQARRLADAAPADSPVAAAAAADDAVADDEGALSSASARSCFPATAGFRAEAGERPPPPAAPRPFHRPSAVSTPSTPLSAISVHSFLSATSNGSNSTSLEGSDSIHSSSVQPDFGLDNRSASPVCMRLTDVLKQARKRAPKRSGIIGTGVAATPTSGSVSSRHNRSSAATTRHSDEPGSQHGGSSRSRLGGATSKTSNFLASLNPARWGRQQSTTSPAIVPPSSTTPNSGSIRESSASLLAKSHSTANIAAQNREKAREWIRDQAARFLSAWSSPSGRGSTAGIGAVAHPALEQLAQLGTQLKEACTASSAEQPLAQRALHRLREMLTDTDVSPFEVNHSGLIGALLHYLTYLNGPNEISNSTDTDAFDGTNAEEPTPEETAAREHRLRLFLNVFADMPISPDASDPLYNFSPNALQTLVSKVNACISQLEQFPVRVHDLPARPATSALKFFNTHQLKCNLQRHPTCTNLKQWKGGTVKIDPLALVQAIERYLVMRGYARVRDGRDAVSGSSGSAGAGSGSTPGSAGPGSGPGSARPPPLDSDDDNTDDDIDDTLAAVVISHTGMKHKLQFLIGDSVLPYNMTVYQAVRQFSPVASDFTDTDPDGDTPLGNASIWVQTHTIYYRSLPSDAASSSVSATGAPTVSGRKGKGTSTKSNTRRKTDDLWNDGAVPVPQSPLTRLLSARLSPEEPGSGGGGGAADASLPALCLQRALFALSRHWAALYAWARCGAAAGGRALLPQSAFANAKLAAKAARQLQDPLVIMTADLPRWLRRVAFACPFALPPDVRHVLLYAVSFERERALARAAEGAAAGAGGAAAAGAAAAYAEAERAAPRLDRRKRTVARHNLLRQAESVMHEFAHSKALLEVQYENEVGTGLGPTLEFYSLVSQELQRADLDLWHGSENFRQKPSSFGGDIVKNNQQPAVVADSDHPHTIDIHNINLADDHNRNTNDGIFESFDMPMLGDAADINLNQNEIRNNKSLDSNETTGPGGGEVAYVTWPCGLFPQALGRNTKASQLSRVKAKFRFLGKFMAKAVMDSRMLDLPFSVTFYRWLIGEERCMSLADVRHVAPDLWRSLQRLQRVAANATAIQQDPTISPEAKKNMIDSLELDGCPIEELGLDFILPGHGCIELRRGGRDTPVTGHNLQQYISLVTHWMLYEGVARQMAAFREGFESVFPLANLRMFYPEELELVFCGAAGGRWEARQLAEVCRPDHGYAADSRAIRNLYDILASYDRDDQRLFLQFVTGSPRLPAGGFKALSPPLTIVRKTVESNVNPDDYLPSVMTCVNYLKLPDYSSMEIMRQKLRIAASEGQHSFHLS